MYEHMTRDAIRQAILAHMAADIAKIEGSFASDQAAAVAVEMAKQYDEMDALLQVFALATTEGTALDQRAADYAITRKAGALAAGSVQLTGSAAATLPAGAILVTEDGLMYATDAAATLNGEGSAVVTVTAMAVGAAYNVPAASVTGFHRNYAGVTAVTNSAAITGGADVETDAALRERVKLRLSAPATSGNKHHYQQWALEVDGVGACKVIPLWDGNGTVKLVLASPTMGAVSADVVTDCEAHIEDLRPIGADVTVISAEQLAVNITATVTLMASASLAEISTAFSAAADAYLRDIAFDAETVSLNKLGYLLIGIPGVTDYSALQLNAAAANIALTAGQVPALGTVTLNAAV